MSRRILKRKSGNARRRPKERAKISSKAAAKTREARAKGNPQRPSGQVKSVGQLFEALVALQARLRAPGGCPWDREQTHESLRTYLVEETYEVLDALDSGDARKIAGEFGDLLLQIVFHADLGRESGRFDIAEVIEHVHAKMVRRHPHVFGEVRADTSGDVLKKWEQLKAEERETGVVASPEQESSGKVINSILDGVSSGLPALVEAQQLTRRAANVGFDWPRVEGILDKLAEETAELREALASDDSSRRSAEIENELGDLFFVCVNLARFLGFDSELALKRASRKFKSRFQVMEQLTRNGGRAFADANAEDLERLWEQAKSRGGQA